MYKIVTHISIETRVRDEKGWTIACNIQLFLFPIPEYVY